jgi:hypothetical protein
VLDLGTGGVVGGGAFDGAEDARDGVGEVLVAESGQGEGELVVARVVDHGGGAVGGDDLEAEPVLDHGLAVVLGAEDDGFAVSDDDEALVLGLGLAEQVEAAALKMEQSRKISTRAEPRCAVAAPRTSVRDLRSESRARSAPEGQGDRVGGAGVGHRGHHVARRVRVPLENACTR